MRTQMFMLLDAIKYCLIEFEWFRFWWASEQTGALIVHTIETVVVEIRREKKTFNDKIRSFIRSIRRLKLHWSLLALSAHLNNRKKKSGKKKRSPNQKQYHYNRHNSSESINNYSHKITSMKVSVLPIHSFSAPNYVAIFFSSCFSLCIVICRFFLFQQRQRWWLRWLWLRFQ